MGKHPCEIFKNIYFKEHLRATASELTSRSIVWKLTSGSHLKPSRLSNIATIPVAFKSGFLKKLAHMPSAYLTPTPSCENRFRMFIFNSYYTKSKRWYAC